MSQACSSRADPLWRLRRLGAVPAGELAPPPTFRGIADDDTASSELPKLPGDVDVGRMIVARVVQREAGRREGEGHDDRYSTCEALGTRGGRRGHARRQPEARDDHGVDTAHHCLGCVDEALTGTGVHGRLCHHKCAWRRGQPLVPDTIVARRVSAQPSERVVEVSVAELPRRVQRLDPHRWT